MILDVSNLSHGFGDRAIFDNVSFRLLKGEHIGLVGANGEGKSTFMNIVTGSLMPDEGKVTWAKNVKVGYLDQHTVLEPGMTIGSVLRDAFAGLFDMEARINEICDALGEVTDDEKMNELLEEMGLLQDLLDSHDFYVIDSKVEEVARAFDLLQLGLDKDVTDLSGGQRTKVLLAKLLLEKPEILLLDEPTNYLDANHIEWLKRYLQEYENAFILISHDIPFLNSVVNIIYHMENCQLNRYVGNYDKFQEVYEVKKSQLEAAYRKQQQEISELKDFVARNKARVATRNMAMSRQKKLDKMEVIELAGEKPKPEFRFKEARTAGKIIFETTDLVIGYEKDKPLSKPINLRMERGDKIAITGTNGIGKTTFLKSVLGLIPAISGQAVLGDYLHKGYFEQECKMGDNTCLQELWEEFPGFTQYEVRSALAKCGLTTKHIESKVRVLSGGEQAKVRLCKLINTETNILLLDEPTNHLDVDAKEELKRALKEYKGSILLVCHEPEFYEGLVTDVWNLERYSLLHV
jgi:ATPase subunit of ABC transporter with duplicated ATPase domains